ncbi:MAG: sigma-70 family RNA polymerase sigma factor [Candidatus Eremiobacteraeota bacterium]|nr:sigma-70 family RNA polymerase sigma factor [Candidatus Eremiobacteraeota bacterium]
MAAFSIALQFWLADRSTENRERVIASYEYLCARAAKKFVRCAAEREDLQQVATIGLIKACDKFDATRKTPFEAYAWLFIVGELMHYVRDHERIVRPPRRLRELEPKWLETQDELTLRLGRQPNICEVAQALSVDAVTVQEVIRCRETTFPGSLDGVQNLLPATHASVQCGNDAQVDRLLIETALRALNSIERAVILALYGQGYNQSELASRLGYSQRQISRLHKAALSKMSRRMSAL